MCIRIRFAEGPDEPFIQSVESAGTVSEDQKKDERRYYRTYIVCGLFQRQLHSGQPFVGAVFFGLF